VLHKRACGTLPAAVAAEAAFPPQRRRGGLSIPTATTMITGAYGALQNMVEAAGIEPASLKTTPVASTCLVPFFESHLPNPNGQGFLETSLLSLIKHRKGDNA